MLSARVIIVALICLLGVFTNIITITKALNPPVGSTEAGLYAAIPAVRTANLFANVTNFVLNGVVLFGCWLTYQANNRGPRFVRRAILGILAVDVIWIIWAYSAGVTSAAWPFFAPADRSTYVTNTFTIGIVALLFGGVVFLLFRKDE